MHGFQNNGNTCYFNSAVQCLLHAREITDRIGKIEDMTCPFAVAYRELIRLYFGQEATMRIDVLPLLRRFQEKFPRFKTFQPHDAQETLFCMMDILEPYLKDIVYGDREQHTIWPGGKKITREEFSMLLLHGEDGKSVDELIKTSEEWHTLTDYVDDDGKMHHVSTTRTSITRYPRILFVSFDKKARVTAGDVLGKYEVRGSIIHEGNLNGGHYISINKRGDKWFLQDDISVSEVEFPETHDHHVLMYSLKTPPP